MTLRENEAQTFATLHTYLRSREGKKKELMLIDLRMVREGKEKEKK